MIVAIADTHATIWYLYSDPWLGNAASALIDRSVAAGDHIGISAITIAEMVYLIEKGRIPSAALNDLQAATADPASVLRQVPFDETTLLR
jgi:PIN domain nuclease of toxin-antitoxin system